MRIVGVAAEQMAAALAAEQLLEAAVGVAPRLDQFLALQSAGSARPSIRAWAEDAVPVRRWQRVQWQ